MENHIVRKPLSINISSLTLPDIEENPFKLNILTAPKKDIIYAPFLIVEMNVIL